MIPTKFSEGCKAAIAEQVTSTLQKAAERAATNAIKQPTPFPYFFAKNVFPEHYYKWLVEYLSEKSDFHYEKFANRTFADDCNIQGLEFMLGKPFFRSVLNLFPKELQERFSGKPAQFYMDLRLIRDHKGYKIGPHTDAPWKVISLLFYLPPTRAFSEFGTSVYVPNDPNFTCKGGPHYPFEPFTKVYTFPYLPNTCLGFWKTDRSFHGVEPIPVEIQRDVLLYNIYCKQPSSA